MFKHAMSKIRLTAPESSQSPLRRFLPANQVKLSCRLSTIGVAEVSTDSEAGASGETLFCMASSSASAWARVTPGCNKPKTPVIESHGFCANELAGVISDHAFACLG